jgi:hypothetical protein
MHLADRDFSCRDEGVRICYVRIQGARCVAVKSKKKALF